MLRGDRQEEVFALGRSLAPPPAAEETFRFSIEPPAGSQFVNAVVGTELDTAPVCFSGTEHLRRRPAI